MMDKLERQRMIALDEAAEKQAVMLLISKIQKHIMTFEKWQTIIKKKVLNPLTQQ